MSTSPTDDDLIGRETDLSTIRDILRTRSLLLTGARRVGKTELCRTLTRVPRQGWRFVRVDLEKTTSAEQAAALVESDLASAGLGAGAVAGAVGQVSGFTVAGSGVELRGSERADPWLRIERAVVQACAHLGEGDTLVLMFDEVPWWLDALRAASGDAAAREALAALRHLRQRDNLVDRFRVVLTGSIGLAGLARQVGASAELNDLMPPYELRPLTPAAARTVFEGSLDERGLATTVRAREAAAAVAGGFPHWTKLLAERLPAGPEPIDEADVEAAVESLLQPRLRVLFADEGGEHLRRRYGATRAATLAAVLHAATPEEGAPTHALLTAVLKAEPGLSRREAEECLYLLADEYYLEEDRGTWRFLLPLLRRWWLRYGTSS